MKRRARDILITLAVPIIGGLIILAALSTSTKSVKVKYSDILNDFDTGKVVSFTLNEDNGKLDYQLLGDKTDTVRTYKIANTTLFWNDISKDVRQNNTSNTDQPTKQISYDVLAGSTSTWLLSMVPTVLMFGILIFAFWFFMRKMSSAMGSDKSMQFGKAKFKQSDDDKRKTTFADVAGADEEKQELAEIVEFLKAPAKFNELGARIPKGVLLVGPPGTGKTLLGRAVAGEAGVPFYSISGSDFVEMFVGVGASRVRDLFATAKKSAPSIIFIDEIDAVGRQRGTGVGGGHDEREQTLNQLLVELDGFGANEGIIVIAATNRPDVLDKALMRPGRFDRQVTVNYPDVKGREEILKVHSRNKPLGPDVSLKTIAQTTSGFTGADLENLLNEAALLAARQNKKAIQQENIEEASIKVVMGTEKKSHVVKDKDKMITAYHEAGHAVVSYFLPTQDPVHQISIIPRGMAAGYTMYRPQEDQGHTSKTNLLETICSMLGGRAAEKLTQEDICTGASNDIQRATEIAHKMVTQFGMSDKLGPILYGTPSHEVFLGRDFNNQPNYSEKISAIIDEEVNSIITAQNKRAEEIIGKNISKMHELAKLLFIEEKVDGDRFRQLMTSANTYTTTSDGTPPVDFALPSVHDFSETPTI